jgi:hypothetical protein
VRLALKLARAPPHTAISSHAVPLWQLGSRLASSEFVLERYELVSVAGVDDLVSAALSRIGTSRG